MHTSTVLTLDSQIRSIVENYLTGTDKFDIDISALNLRIYLKGTAWAGVVDRPLAKFLVDFDKKLTDELKINGIELPIAEHGLIALKVEDGSLDAVLQYSKGILAEVKKLKPKDQIFILVMMATGLGVPTAPSIIEKLNEPEIARINSVERVELIEAVSKVVEASKTRELQQPIRGLINQMGENDVIELPGQTQALKKDQVKDVLAKGSRGTSTTFYIDNRYIVEGLTTKKTNQWEISLKWGADFKFKAKLMLTSEEITELMESFQLAHQSRSNIAPDFQITAEFNTKGELQNATVVGMGDQRKESKTIGDVIAQIAPRVATQAEAK